MLTSRTARPRIASRRSTKRIQQLPLPGTPTLAGGGAYRSCTDAQQDGRPDARSGSPRRTTRNGRTSPSSIRSSAASTSRSVSSTPSAIERRGPSLPSPDRCRRNPARIRRRSGRRCSGRRPCRRDCVTQTCTLVVETACGDRRSLLVPPVLRLPSRLTSRRCTPCIARRQPEDRRRRARGCASS